MISMDTEGPVSMLYLIGFYQALRNECSTPCLIKDLYDSDIIATPLCCSALGIIVCSYMVEFNQ